MLPVLALVIEHGRYGHRIRLLTTRGKTLFRFTLIEADKAQEWATLEASRYHLPVIYHVKPKAKAKH